MKRATLILTTLLASSITCASVSFPHVAVQPPPTHASHVGGLLESQEQRTEWAQRAWAEFRTGRGLLHRGDSAGALVHLDSALELFRQVENRRGEAATHDLLGELYERQGGYEIARDHFNKAHDLFAGPISPKEKKRVSPYDADLMLAKLGQIHYRLGDLDAARSAFERMNAKKPSKKKSWLSKGAEAASSAIDNDTGRDAAAAAGALSTGGVEYQYYRQSVAYSAREMGLGRIAYFKGQPEAKEHFDNVLKVTKGDLAFLTNVGQTPRFRAAAHTALGDIATLGLDYKKAVGLYDDAIKEATKGKRLDLTWPAERGKAHALWLLASGEKNPKKAQKLRDRAVAGYLGALRIIEQLVVGSVRADEARTTFLASTNEVFVEASSALAEQALASEGAQAGTPLRGTALDLASKALAIVEAGRARSLLDLLSETGSSVTADIPPGLLRIKQDNLRQQEEIVAQINGTDSSGGPLQGSLDKLEASLDRLQAEYDNNENRIREQSWRYKSLTSPQPLMLADIQQKVLDPDTALLEYSLGGKDSYLWLVTREEVRLFKLPARSTLAGEVEEMRKRMIPERVNTSIFELTNSDGEAQRGLFLSRKSALGDPRPFASASHALYQSVLAQAAPFVGPKRLLVIGDGPLNYVPFEALVTDSAGADYTNLSYLIQTNEVVYAPSASVIAAIRGHASNAAASDSILLIADPVFDLSDPRAATLTRTPHTQDDRHAFGLDIAAADVERRQLGSPLLRNAIIRRIPATGSEAEQIEQYALGANLKPQVWRNLDANEANVSGDLSRYRVLHFATHGLLDAERPQFSGLVLSLVGNREDKDGFLRTDEVFNLKLGSPLVMLSACESGLGKEERGEGVIGLTRAFIYAGAPTVGVTLWSVDDQPTAKLMAAFYDNYLTKRGTTPSAAMRAAQRAMIANKDYATPYQWAAFILIGDYQENNKIRP
ncbi:MAG TPA: CHAT domain-containing tetratricopeptide repeat protein [Pyrinomonadaceae bacterium]|nr:CHAT domain-containing tetratricopeptide repeat protein [Pyrinomonadaceae bacterium]